MRDIVGNTIFDSFLCHWGCSFFEISHDYFKMPSSPQTLCLPSKISICVWGSSLSTTIIFKEFFYLQILYTHQKLKKAKTWQVRFVKEIDVEAVMSFFTFSDPAQPIDGIKSIGLFVCLFVSILLAFCILNLLYAYIVFVKVLFGKFLNC